MAKIIIDNSTPTSPDYLFYCPGCKQHHGVWTSKPNVVNGKEHLWEFNGNLNTPTFSPSIHITRHRTGKQEAETICHSFVENGYIRYLSDSIHHLKGQTIPLPEVD